MYDFSSNTRWFAGPVTSMLGHSPRIERPMYQIINIVLILFVVSAGYSEDVHAKFLPTIKASLDKLHCDSVSEIDRDLTVLSYSNDNNMSPDLRVILSFLEGKFKNDKSFLHGYSVAEGDNNNLLSINASLESNNITEYLLIKSVTLDGKPKILITDILRITK